MWVRSEVMGHIRILARPHNAVRAALQASWWLLDLIVADESPRKESVQFSKMTISTSDCYSENRGVRMSIACCSLVHRLDLPGAAQPHLAPLQIPTQAEYRDVEPDDITTVGAERQALDLTLCVYYSNKHCSCSDFPHGK